ncbi:hypothetical protein GOODEAATRI_021003 [Goodea atripinnis]|uniref:Uncharacterized protein n=1 Tax=Goodea atripinnis TaxID=208336 RepID=A0ABV0PZS5_9TELE
MIYRAEGKSVCWGQVLRLLSLLDTLVSQRACKSSTLHLLSGSVSGDEQVADLFPLLLSLLVPPAGHSLQQQQQCSVLVGTILQSLCDQGSSEEPACVAPRLLSGSEMKSLLQWEDPESHPLTVLEKQMMVKVDLVALAQECCPELDLKAELERSFLSEPSSPGHTKSDYTEPAKRAHILPAPRGRGNRGGFGQNVARPHDIFRLRKQNTSRPPSMHVDDFVAAEFKDIGNPLGILPPKRLPKSTPKLPTRGLFTGNRGRATFHNQTRFFTPPQPKGVLLSGDTFIF